MNSLLHKNSLVSKPFMPLSKTKIAVQPKLTINEPGDQYEQEADAMAEQVMRMPANENQVKPTTGLIGASVQRKCAACEEEEKKKKPVMRKSENGNGSVQASPSFASSLQASKGAGSPLPQGTRSFMENAFSTDFSGVRIHADSKASEMNKGINARAFTNESDIYFGSGEYMPQSNDGKKLLAHELTHVVQQNNHNNIFTKSKGETTDTLTSLARETAFQSINKWELSSGAAIDRYRNWLSHNMILFITDVLISGKGNTAIDAIKGDFTESVMSQVPGNLSSLAVVDLGVKNAGKQFAKYFIVARGAKILGGIISFVIGSIVEALVGELLDKTNEIVKATSGQIDTLITTLVNPIANNKQKALTGAVQSLRDQLLSENITTLESLAIAGQITESINDVDKAFLNQNDESLYRQLALKADVYSKDFVPAEEKAPVKLGGNEKDIAFTMQHRVVDTGQTVFDVFANKGTFVLKLKSYNCINEDGYSPIDLKSPDTPNSFKQYPPADEFFVTLSQRSTGLFSSDSQIGVSRKFNVGREEYGTWYNLPKGSYKITIFRVDRHPVALCAAGKYWIQI